MMRAPSLPHEAARAERTANGFCPVNKVGELAQLGGTPRIGLGGFDDERAAPEDLGLGDRLRLRVRVRIAGAAAEGFHLGSVRLRGAPRQCNGPRDRHGSG